MDEEKEKKQRKMIWGIIGALCIVAVGLGVVIGVNIFKRDGTTGDDGSGNETIITDDEEFQQDEALEQYASLSANLEKMRMKVDEILNENQNDVEAVKKLYSDKISEVIEEDNIDLVEPYLREGTNMLYRKGFKSSALEFLLSGNIKYVSGIERCAMLFDTISLARELGKDDIAKKYESLIKDTDDEFGKTCAESEDSKAMYESNMKERESL